MSGATTDDVLDPTVPEFEDPPPDPMVLMKRWFDHAHAHGVAEPDVLALATVDATGTPSTRIVRVLRRTARGLVFSSHSNSPKACAIAATGRVSGVFYWRETQRQIVVGGSAERLGAGDAEALWFARAPQTHPMSVATTQSAPMDDERGLLARARELAAGGLPLSPSAHWAGYEIVPDTIEFWHVGVERLHRRLLYRRNDRTWASGRLQP